MVVSSFDKDQSGGKNQSFLVALEPWGGVEAGKACWGEGVKKKGNYSRVEVAREREGMARQGPRDPNPMTGHKSRRSIGREGAARYPTQGGASPRLGKGFDGLGREKRRTEAIG